jgi:leucyl-tRNA synthetase
MKAYDHKKIEKKWQTRWEEMKLYRAEDFSARPKFYPLVEFPYPSGDGLHVGHIRPYVALDTVARKRRMQGFDVLYPFGWDAFGLPTENYAIKTGIHPKIVTKNNTDTFRRQVKSIGVSFDWSREINTSDPGYYKWTQWIFLRLHKAGLAYKAKTLINWCPKDKIGLANEEVVGGACERCGTPVEKREKEQWMLAITKYAERLYKDLDDVDYIERAKTQQRNWIGPSEGAEIEFAIVDLAQKIKIFTTRPDTLFGATYMVLAPEHPLLTELAARAENKKDVEKYVASAKKSTDIERTAEGKDKTGVELKGIKAINPANKEEIPVFVADYVLGGYGTGAIMAVPAHDERDYEFAKKYSLPIREIVAPDKIDENNPPRAGKRNVPRRIIHAVLRRKDGRILVLDWKQLGWKTLVIGGVEEGESLVEAATRELAEETGYTKVCFVKELGDVYAEFFAKHKDENRRAHATGLLFDLMDEDRKEVSEEEKQKHEPVWMTIEEASSQLIGVEPPIFLPRLKEDTWFYTGPGTLVRSGNFDGIDSEEAKKKITEAVGGKWVTTYKLRDWIFSRQRYWGEPIPMVFCKKDGWVPVSESDLPVLLPEVENYKPTDTGESPLANITEWVNTACPVCGGAGRRETDVMPNWAGSSWYYLRYCDPHNGKEFADKEKLKYWLDSGLPARSPERARDEGGVDWYNGGMEHTTLHLLYSRFWHKALFDLGLVPTNEPYRKRTSHGVILAGDGSKMSKSKGNVVNPDTIVERYGADTLRVYEMFMGPFDQAIVWSEESLIGPRRFLEKVWRLHEKVAARPASAELTSLLHETIKKVDGDIEAMRFNTAVSALMILVREAEREEEVSAAVFADLLLLLSPFAPHMTEELWSMLGNTGSIHAASWPVYDAGKVKHVTVRIAVQIDGKKRDDVEILAGASEAQAHEAAMASAMVKKWLEGRRVERVVYVQGRLLNIVTQKA